MAAAAAPLAVALRAVCEDLRELGVAYAVVGGLAVSARAEPRLTRDVDLAVAVRDDAEAEQLVAALVAGGYRLLMSVEQTRTGRLSTIRFAPPTQSALVVDLLFASSGIEPEIVEEAERLEILPGITAPVARAGHLVAMKLLARDDRERPQDLDDIRALMKCMNASERRRLTRAIELIARRGYARGRNLARAWREVSRKG